MDIGRIAVVGGPDGDDRLQRGRLARGDLEAVEPAPADAIHRHLAVAPVLRGCPCNRIDAIQLFLHRVFVVQQAFAVAGAANIQPQAGIAVPGQIAVHFFVARPRPVALAVGQVFQDHRHLARAFGPPKPPGKAGAVRQGNPDVLLFDQGIGIVGAGMHGRVHQFIGAPPSALRRVT